MKSPDRPLRILAIVNLPWDSRLGASRVWIELAKQWTRAGHTVEKFCLSDAYPETPVSGARSALRQALFPRKAAAYVRENADRFDVIDCLIGVLPFSKDSLRFRGLVVARSVGLFRLYDRFLRQSRKIGPSQSKGRWFGRFFHHFIEWRSRSDSEKSIRACDLLNLPNDDERRELATDQAVHVPAIVEPYGLDDEFFQALATAAVPAEQRLQCQKICFIGMWGPRKGSREWRQIMAAVWQRHPAAQFLFLGTMFDETVVRADLGFDNSTQIFCRPAFAVRDLPSLIADCVMGVFPSHVEGFGLALLEQLAAGLPTIAYDVPGPRQILRTQSERLLIPVGDTAAVAARAAEILSLSVPDYEKLSEECVAIAQRYRWPEIANNTITHYRVALDSLGQRPMGAKRE
jgi:glycosyltransferase involved in cell wall biosynthesis